MWHFGLNSGTEKELDGKKWKSCAGLVKMYISVATVETSMEELQKIKNRTTI